MGEAPGHTGEDLIFLSLVIKDCQVGGQASYPRRTGLSPLPKVKSISCLRGSLDPWEEMQNFPQNPTLPVSPRGVGSYQDLVDEWRVV